jgi:23S rRNA pseudouridine2605 synthase
MQERLQKVLAGAGVASRRDAESLISSGKVTVNGKVVKEPGLKVDPERDNVSVEGVRIASDVRHLYVLLNKPKGYVSTRKDRNAVNTVMDLVIPALEERFGKGDPSVAGLHPVGRLDAQSEGLLILTNDGDFTQSMTHPRHQVPKRYEAEVRGVPDREAIEKLRAGIPLFGQRTMPARVRLVRADRTRGISRVEVELREGRNQQVRRMLQAVGFPVNRLTRTSIGPISLTRLRPGQWRFLTAAEVELLRKQATHAEPEVSDVPRRPAGRRPGAGTSRRGPEAAAWKKEREAIERATAENAESQRPAAGSSRGERGTRPAAGPRPHGPRGASAGPRPPRGTRSGSAPSAGPAAGPRSPRGPKAGPPPPAGPPPRAPRGPKTTQARTSDAAPRPRPTRPAQRTTNPKGPRGPRDRQH